MCLGIFTVEYLGRVLTCPEIIPFLKSPMNIIDALAVFPFYIELIVMATGGGSGGASQTRIVRLIRLLRVLRLLRLWTK